MKSGVDAKPLSTEFGLLMQFFKTFRNIWPIGFWGISYITAIFGLMLAKKLQ